MYLSELIEQKKMSQYRLSKESGVSQAAISDICNGKVQIEKCSAGTVYKLSKTLGVSMESLLEKEMKSRTYSRRASFSVYKSNVCHLVKDKGDEKFILDTLMSDEIRVLYERKWYPESFYLLAMVDYLSRLNDVPLCKKYEDLRHQKLKDTIYPAGISLMDEIMKTDKNKKESLNEAIPEFWKYNIVESEIRDVC